MSNGEIIVLIVLSVVLTVATLGMFICIVAFPTKSSAVPPLPIKKQKGGIK